MGHWDDPPWRKGLTKISSCSYAESIFFFSLNLYETKILVRIGFREFSILYREKSIRSNTYQYFFSQGKRLKKNVILIFVEKKTVWNLDFAKEKQRRIRLITNDATRERLDQGRISLAVPRVGNHRKAGTVDFSFKANPNVQFLLRFFSVSMKRYF